MSQQRVSVVDRQIILALTSLCDLCDRDARRLGIWLRSAEGAQWVEAKIVDLDTLYRQDVAPGQKKAPKV